MPDATPARTRSSSCDGVAAMAPRRPASVSDQGGVDPTEERRSMGPGPGLASLRGTDRLRLESERRRRLVERALLRHIDQRRLPPACSAPHRRSSRLLAALGHPLPPLATPGHPRPPPATPGHPRPPRPPGPMRRLRPPLGPMSGETRPPAACVARRGRPRADQEAGVGVPLPLFRAARRASTSALAESSSSALNCASRDDELTSAIPFASASSRRILSS